MSLRTPGGISASPLRIGTRSSALALAQAGWVAERIGGRGERVELVEIRTPDDAPLTDKSRFTAELERALGRGEIEIAVHSAKDLPSRLDPALQIVAVPIREAPGDAWIGAASSLDEVTEGATVGTASLRRRAQLLAHRGDLVIEELRGNVDTRLGRLASGDFDGIVLALAGLRRLGREAEASFVLPEDDFTPAAGQGSLALQVRIGDERAAAAAGALDHPDSHAELRCERAAIAALGASCHTPVGIRAVASDATRASPAQITVAGFCGLPDGSEWIRDRLTGPASDPEALGRQLAERMAAAGAAELLEAAEAWT